VLSQARPPALRAGIGSAASAVDQARDGTGSALTLATVTPAAAPARSRLSSTRGSRDYDEIEKTVPYPFDVGSHGERVSQVIDELAGYAELGFGTAMGGVTGAWTLEPLERIGSEVIPAVAGL
jgi:hypothetical protein